MGGGCVHGDALGDADGGDLVLLAMVVELFAEHQVARAEGSVDHVGVKLDGAAPTVEKLKHREGDQGFAAHAGQDSEMAGGTPVEQATNPKGLPGGQTVPVGEVVDVEANEVALLLLLLLLWLGLSLCEGRGAVLRLCRALPPP